MFLLLYPIFKNIKIILQTLLCSMHKVDLALYVFVNKFQFH